MAAFSKALPPSSEQKIEVSEEFLYYTNINSQRPPPAANSQNRQSQSI